MQGQTRGVFMLGKGAIYSTSQKQKLNILSSTESELIALADILPQTIWTANFLNKQGYDVGKSVIYQDNMSTMLLAKNGRCSIRRRSRHINARFFWMVDRVEQGELKLEYYPTKDMLSDFYTKSLQGAKFLQF